MKQYGEFFIALDQAGFPLIRRKSWDHFISLLPISVFQYRKFDNVGFETREDEPVWKNFIRGVPLASLKRYFEFLSGEDTDFIKGSYQLPSKEQWLQLLESADEIKNLKPQLEMFCLEENVAEPAEKWIKNDGFPLVKEGLLEMIGEEQTSSEWFNQTVRCIGKPIEELWPNTWEPQNERDVYWWIPEDESSENEEIQGPNLADLEADRPQGRQLVGFRIVKQIPSLAGRIGAVKEEAEKILDRPPGSSSKNAVYGPDLQPYDKPRFRYLSPWVTNKQIGENGGFNVQSDIFFLGVLLVEAINGYPMLTLNDVDHIFGPHKVGFPGYQGPKTHFNENVKDLIVDWLQSPEKVNLASLPDRLHNLMSNL